MNTELKKESLKDIIIRELKSHRGEPISLEMLRLKAFGATDNVWQAFCQKLTIANVVRTIRYEFGIYIFSMTINEHRGYIVIEKKEDFKYIIEKTVSTINGFRAKLDKMKRDSNSSEYKRKVERFFKTGNSNTFKV